jgi:hypothetical protein
VRSRAYMVVGDQGALDRCADEPVVPDRGVEGEGRWTMRAHSPAGTRIEQMFFDGANFSGSRLPPVPSAAARLGGAEQEAE